MTYRLRPLAEADLAGIVRYIASDNPEAARRWLDDMARHCENLGLMPGIGVARPDIRPDLRLLPVGRYLILYEMSADGVDIVRVLHSARRWEELL